MWLYHILPTPFICSIHVTCSGVTLDPQLHKCLYITSEAAAEWMSSDSEPLYFDTSFPIQQHNLLWSLSLEALNECFQPHYGFQKETSDILVEFICRKIPKPKHFWLFLWQQWCVNQVSQVSQLMAWIHKYCRSSWSLGVSSTLGWLTNEWEMLCLRWSYSMLHCWFDNCFDLEASTPWTIRHNNQHL